MNELGLLSEFCHVDEKAPPELAEEYARAAEKEPTKAGDIGFVEPDDPRILKEPSKPGTHTRGGFLPEDHWLYGAGPIVAGRAILKPPPEHGTVKVTDVGSLPPDHPIYSRGPMIFGRPSPPKKTPEKK